MLSSSQLNSIQKEKSSPKKMLKKNIKNHTKNHTKTRLQTSFGHTPSNPWKKMPPPRTADLPSFLALPTVQEGHGSTRHAGATRTADAVDVVVGTWIRRRGDGGDNPEFLKVIQLPKNQQFYPRNAGFQVFQGSILRGFCC